MCTEDEKYAKHLENQLSAFVGAEQRIRELEEREKLRDDIIDNASDRIKDLITEIAGLRERVKELEAERDIWKRLYHSQEAIYEEREDEADEAYKKLESERNQLLKQYTKFVDEIAKANNGRAEICDKLRAERDRYRKALEDIVDMDPESVQGQRANHCLEVGR